MLFFEKIMHLFRKTLKGGLSGGWSGDNNVQSGFHIPQMGPEAFAQAALDEVACDGVAYFFADGKTDLDALAFGIKHHQISGRGILSSFVHIGESPILFQPKAFLQGIILL